MVSTDPIADMLTRIRNAIAVNRRTIVLPHSNSKQKIAAILVENNFLEAVSTEGEGPTKTLEITISAESRNSDITEIVRLSSPGRRHYAKANDIPVVKRGRGLVVISTSKGLMTGDEARAKRLGGELICKVY